MAETPVWQELKAISLFADLTENEIQRIMKLSFIKKYEPGSTLFVEGMPGEVLYVVKSGQVDIVKKTSSGDRVLSEIVAGGFLGELSLLDDSPRSATARVKGPTELIVVTRKCFQQMLADDPSVTSKLLAHFLKVTAARLRATTKLLEAH